MPNPQSQLSAASLPQSYWPTDDEHDVSEATGVDVVPFDPVMATVFGQTIAADHRAVYALRDQYIAAPTVEEKQELLNLLMWNIARHVTTEEILVHPMCEKFLGSDMGGKLAEFDSNEHAAVKKSLLQLLELGASPGSTEFDGAVEKVLGDLHRHNDSEEASDVPTLEKNMTSAQAQELSQAIEATKAFFVPSRFDRGSGDIITARALHAALTVNSDSIGKDLFDFLGISPASLPLN
ncbi:hypothetical protein GALMADRAFT_143354 [Galerina marginata CBS 339.88]|uniref:Hemerythrin-like domain-containing protein n=1 Tax=Galerina marginata (strain CBS 339.88) TaxID=685588 RepID=A0A067SWG3_GALM3|nr:hypothetical protein GALMADRAFT_143354 [Galerina marginata CBS 339.88]